jgi:hypothetical protein
MSGGTWLWYCSDCRGIPLPSADSWALFVRVNGLQLCASCWRARGRPWPVEEPPESSAAIAEHEAEVRRRMLARGGTDRHLVRSGRT